MTRRKDYFHLIHNQSSLTFCDLASLVYIPLIPSPIMPLSPILTLCFNFLINKQCSSIPIKCYQNRKRSKFLTSPDLASDFLIFDGLTSRSDLRFSHDSELWHPFAMVGKAVY